MTTSDGVRLTVHGLIPPTLQGSLPATGVIEESGRITETGIDLTMVVPDDAEIEPGTSVTIRLCDGYLYAISDEQRQRQQYEREAQAHLHARERRLAKQRRYEEAIAFWSDYDLPFDYRVAIKGRRAGLLRGSSGDGTVSNTVTHLYVLESFEAGRLSRTVPKSPRDRDEGVYLCDDTASFRHTEGCERTSPDGVTYSPPVTCERCLDLMERFGLASQNTPAGQNAARDQEDSPNGQSQ